MIPFTPTCDTCDSPATQKCAGCKWVYYCCHKCQVGDWIDHKPLCKSIKAHPPPAGFIPNFSAFAFINRTATTETLIPIYPSSWAVGRSQNGKIDTVYDAAFDQQMREKREVKVFFALGLAGVAEWKEKEKERTSARQVEREKHSKEVEKNKMRNKFEGLTRDLAYMKLVDTYRYSCARRLRIHGAEEPGRPMFTPCYQTFHSFFISPLMFLTGDKRATLLPPDFPTNYDDPSGPDIIVQDILSIVARFPGASVFSPVSDEELSSLNAFGGREDMIAIEEGVRHGVRAGTAWAGEMRAAGDPRFQFDDGEVE